MRIIKNRKAGPYNFKLIGGPHDGSILKGLSCDIVFVDYARTGTDPDGYIILEYKPE